MKNSQLKSENGCNMGSLMVFSGLNLALKKLARGAQIRGGKMNQSLIQ